MMIGISNLHHVPPSCEKMPITAIWLRLIAHPVHKSCTQSICHCSAHLQLIIIPFHFYYSTTWMSPSFPHFSDGGAIHHEAVHRLLRQHWGEALLVHHPSGQRAHLLWDHRPPWTFQCESGQGKGQPTGLFWVNSYNLLFNILEHGHGTPENASSDGPFGHHEDVSRHQGPGQPAEVGGRLCAGLLGDGQVQLWRVQPSQVPHQLPQEEAEVDQQ